MRVERVELYWLDLHLGRAMTTAKETVSDRPVIVVRLVSDLGEGWGECAALSSAAYADETAETAWSDLTTRLIPALEGFEWSGTGPLADLSAQLAHRWGPYQTSNMAGAAVEMAGWDAVLRGRSVSLSAELGVGPSRVAAGVVVGSGSPTAVVDEVAECLAAGYQRVKIKISPGHDSEILQAVRSVFPAVAIQADANGSYVWPQDRHRLAALDALGLVCLEQPFAASDLAGHAAAAEVLATPICLDESVASLEDLAAAIAAGAAHMICVKPARLGGIANAVEAHDLCRSLGIPVWMGGMYECGLARAANASIAGLAGFSIPGDLGGGDRFAEADPFGALEVIDGWVSLWSGPGVGPAPDVEHLEKVRTRTWAIRF